MSNTTTHRACRNLDIAMDSLANAEALELVLRTALRNDPDNSYMVDAHRRAFELVQEMQADVEDGMDQVDPEVFEAWLAKQR